jgi:hypothetical protein
MKIVRSDESCISNPKSRNLKLDVATSARSNHLLCNFESEMQDSSDFQFSTFIGSGLISRPQIVVSDGNNLLFIVEKQLVYIGTGS